MAKTGFIPLIVSPRYSVDMGEHVFVSQKFMGVAKQLVAEGTITTKDLLLPVMPSMKDLLLVHTPAWIYRLISGNATPEDEKTAEMPLTPRIIEGHILAAGGTIKACRLALENGLGLHSGGGSHHAFPDHGEGFCIINDVAIGIRKMQAEGGIKKAIVIDLDVHQGNGTAAIFSGDKQVFTFSIHQEGIFPDIREESSLDIDIKAGTGDEDYLAILEKNLFPVLDNHKPELAIYLAGADPYEKDQLGGLRLSFEGLRRRDETVFSACFKRGIPAAVVLGGGYARDPADTIKIHAQTFKAALSLKAK